MRATKSRSFARETNWQNSMMRCCSASVRSVFGSYVWLYLAHAVPRSTNGSRVDGLSIAPSRQLEARVNEVRVDVLDEREQAVIANVGWLPTVTETFT